MSGALRAALDVYIAGFVRRFSFETSGAGKLMQTLVKMSVFLQGQDTSKPMVNEDLLLNINEKAESATDAELAKKYRKFIHLYLAFACQLCYYKSV